MRTKRKSRLLSLGLCLCMLFSTFPLSGMTYAAEMSCPNHQEHTQECGYVQAQEGALCKHEQGQHDENCGYSAGTPEVPCNMGCAETDEDGQIIRAEGCAYTPAVPGTPCKHEAGQHDAECGYIEAVEGAPCTHTCEKCDGSAERTPEACTKTEGCTLPAGHDGDCAVALGAPANDIIETTDYTFNKTSGLLTVKTKDGTVTWRNDTNIAADEQDRLDAVTSVEVKDGVTNVRTFAFKNCVSLSSVILPSSLQTIEGLAFDSCTSLTHIDLPDKLELIMAGAFAESGLTSITIPASVTEMFGRVFTGCPDLKTVIFKGTTAPKLPDDDSSSLIFAGMASPPTVYVPVGAAGYEKLGVPAIQAVTWDGEINKKASELGAKSGSTIHITGSNTGGGATLTVDVENITVTSDGNAVSGVNIAADTGISNLTIRDLSLTAQDDEIAIYFASAATLTVQGTCSITGGDGEHGSDTICGDQNLTVEVGSASLTATGGNSAAAYNGGYGIRVYSKLTVNVSGGGFLTARGGDSQESAGSGLGGKPLILNNDGTVLAESGKVNSMFYGTGIYSNSDMTLTGSGATTANGSIGIQLYNGGTLTEDGSGTVEAWGINAGVSFGNGTNKLTGNGCLMAIEGGSGYGIRSYSALELAFTGSLTAHGDDNSTRGDGLYVSGDLTVSQTSASLDLRPGAGTSGKAIRIFNGSLTNHSDIPDEVLTIDSAEPVVWPAYTVAVNDGKITNATESGYYAPGTTVEFSATVPSGKVFDKWKSDDVTFADANSADTSFTMPGKAVTVTAVYKDEEAPTGEITLAGNHWKTFLNTISFGLFYKEKQDVTIKAEDTSGEAVLVEYFLSAEVLTLDAVKAKTEGWKSYKGKFTINPDEKFIVYAQLTDAAGNMTFLSSEGVVLDATPPAIEGAQDGQTYDKALNITVTDAYLETVTVNGAAQPVKDGQSAFALTENGDYTIIAKDKAGNEAKLSVKIELPPAAYILTFDANGGTPVPGEQTLQEGDKPASVDDPAKEGYTFLGWYDGEEKVDLNRFTMPAGNVTLTAHFEKIIESNITLSIPFTVAVEQGGNVPAPKETLTFAVSPILRDGMTEEEAAQLKADFAAVVTVEANSIETDGKGAYTGILKLTASEENLGRYLADGFMVTEVKGSAENWTYDDTAYQVIPRRDDDGGYTHFAFSKGENETAAMTFTNIYTKNVVSPPVTYYTLTFEPNGGSRMDGLKKSSGTVIDLAEYKPTREGYEFGGWYADKDLKNAVTSVTLDSDQTVYAKWTKKAGTPENPTPKPGTFQPENPIPQTGDTSNTLPFVLLALASLLGCIGLISCKKLGRKKRQG